VDGGIDWFMLAITVPLVPAVAVIGALFWLRAGRPKPDEVAGALDTRGVRATDDVVVDR